MLPEGCTRSSSIPATAGVKYDWRPGPAARLECAPEFSHRVTWKYFVEQTQTKIHGTWYFLGSTSERFPGLAASMSVGYAFCTRRHDHPKLAARQQLCRASFGWQRHERARHRRREMLLPGSAPSYAAVCTWRVCPSSARLAPITQTIKSSQPSNPRKKMPLNTNRKYAPRIARLAPSAT